MGMSIDLIIPVHNEERHLREQVSAIVVKALFSFKEKITIIFVENGSQDKSWELLKELTRPDASHGRVSFQLVQIPEGNYGLAIKAGCEASHAEWVGLAALDWFDENFFAQSTELLSSTDLVCADKSGKNSDQRQFIRRLLSLGYRRVTHLLLDLPVNDTHGLFLGRGDQIREASKDCMTDRGTFPTELFMRLHWRGCRFKVIPVSVSEQRPSRFKLGRLLAYYASGLLQLSWIRLKNKTAAITSRVH